MAKVKLDKNGVPADANDWTEADWLDLHNTMQRLIRRVAARHRIRAEHAAIAAHNADVPGMPNGPCQCPVCK